MQQGFVLMLAAFAVGLVAAWWEKSRVMTAQLCMALCGFLFMLSTRDVGMRQELMLVWGNETARYTVLSLWYAGAAIMLVSVYWAIKSLWEGRQRKKPKK